MLKRYIGNRAFYKRVFQIAMPIIIQNGITNFVSLLDNIMVGQVGTLPMSGVSIVNQLIFVFNLCIFGALSGAIITERVYLVPGAGNLLTTAINTYDNGVIVGLTLFYSTLSILSIIFGDILMALVDPRISFSSKAR